ncbi:MAG: cytochrome C [Desulfovibrio sp.]|nr:MAG: cytochrome C [Desulfovibrio sp.]
MKTLSLAALTLAVVFAAPALFAEQTGIDGIQLDYLAKIVTFNHSSHADLDCAKCHHQWDGASDITGCATPGCHDVFDKQDRTERSLYHVIHKGSGDIGGCVSCHKAEAGDDRERKKLLAGCARSACHP